MEKRLCKKEAARHLDALQEFLDGPMVGLHEFLPSDPEYKERVYRLFELVSNLRAAIRQ